MLIHIVLLCLCYQFASASTACQSPSVTSSSYVADDAVFHYSTAFVVEFVLKCQNEQKDLSLYGEVNGKLMPASLSVDTNRYQISWTDDHENLPSGTYTVNIHDEDGYSAIRKAQRNGESLSSVKPLGTVDVHHRGPQKGPVAQSHMLAALLATVVYLIAYNWKTKIQQ